MKYLLLLAGFFIFNLTTKAQDMKIEDNPDRPQYVISVSEEGVAWGDIVLELFDDIAPRHANNFDSLVSIGFFDGTAFHRVVPGFMIQGGDPNSKNKPKDTWGYGDPSLTRVPAEFSKYSHTRGIISAARSNDPNSATSQFFICLADASFLDGKYSIYGRVLSGMEVVDKIAAVKLVKQPSSPEVSSPVNIITVKIVKKEKQK